MENALQGPGGTETLERLGLSTDALVGKVAVVTGGARGIGEAIVEALAHLGASVVIIDVREEGSAVAERLRQRYQVPAHFELCDIRETESVDAAAGRVLELFGDVHVLVNNAAWMSIASMDALSVDAWENAFQTNILGPVRLIKAFLPQMISRDEGTIANIISVDSMPFASHYAASKIALKSLILSLRDELGTATQVSVFGYVPGMVSTPLVEETIPQYAACLGLAMEDFVSRLPNPGYRGFMPAADSAAALAHHVVHAAGLHGQFVDPFNVLAAANVIELPASNEEDPTPGGNEDFDLEKITTEFKRTVAEITTINKNLEHRIEVRTRELREERAKSERLLLNILPQPVADRLKQNEAPIADSLPNVSVLFADICNFSEYAGKVPAETLVTELNDIFSMLDELAGRFEIEKIKTIGDCYMAVGGLVTQRPDHLDQVCRLALEMRDAVGAFAFGDGQLKMRLGIHCGPVVAGVIGTSKFSYDLWGPTVNFASRLESHGSPGMIQVSEEVVAEAKTRFVFEPRGAVDIKGVGERNTWYLMSELPDAG